MQFGRSHGRDGRTQRLSPSFQRLHVITLGNDLIVQAACDPGGNGAPTAAAQAQAPHQAQGQRLGALPGVARPAAAGTRNSYRMFRMFVCHRHFCHLWTSRPASFWVIMFTSNVAFKI